MYTNLIIHNQKGDLVHEKAVNNFFKVMYADALAICEEHGAWLELTDSGAMFRGCTKTCRKKLRDLYSEESLTRIERNLFLPGG